MYVSAILYSHCKAQFNGYLFASNILVKHSPKPKQNKTKLVNMSCIQLNPFFNLMDINLSHILSQLITEGSYFVPVLFYFPIEYNNISSITV